MKFKNILLKGLDKLKNAKTITLQKHLTNESFPELHKKLYPRIKQE
ncbi:MAG: hypothetical protein PHU66_06395 [Bacteroidaceae bacterium]|nr:hypothetical protein [Bacteroidaceae bacterium]